MSHLTSDLQNAELKPVTYFHVHTQACRLIHERGFGNHNAAGSNLSAFTAQLHESCRCRGHAVSSFTVQVLGRAAVRTALQVDDKA